MKFMVTFCCSNGQVECFLFFFIFCFLRSNFLPIFFLSLLVCRRSRDLWWFCMVWPFNFYGRGGVAKNCTAFLKYMVNIYHRIFSIPSVRTIKGLRKKDFSQFFLTEIDPRNNSIIHPPAMTKHPIATRFSSPSSCNYSY